MRGLAFGRGCVSYLVISVELDEVFSAELVHRQDWRVDFCSFLDLFQRLFDSFAQGVLELLLSFLLILVVFLGLLRLQCLWVEKLVISLVKDSLRHVFHIPSIAECGLRCRANVRSKIFSWQVGV